MRKYLKGYALCRRPPLFPRGCHLRGSVPPFRHPGKPFWHLGSTLGSHFGTPGPPWRTMGAAGWTQGGPICFDSEVILGPVHLSFLVSIILKFNLFGLVSRSLFLLVSESKCRRWKNRGIRKECIAKIDSPHTIVFYIFRNRFFVVLGWFWGCFL